MYDKGSTGQQDLQDGLIELARVSAAQGNVNPRFLRIPYWYINGYTGSNTNSGTIQSAPLADFGEVLRRWGTSSPINLQNTVVRWLDDDGQAASDAAPYVFNPIMPQGNTPGVAPIFNLYGSKIPIASGVLGAVTAMNVATGALLLADLGEAAENAVGMLIVNSTRGDAVAWVDSIVAGSVCALTQPAAPSVTPPPAWWPGGGGAPPLVNSFAEGDSFTLYRLPKVKFGAVLPTTIGFWPPTFDGMLCMIGNLWIPDLTGSGAESFLKNPTLRMTESRCDSLVETQSAANNGVGEQIFNCWLPASCALAGEGVYAGAIGTFNTFITEMCGGVLDANVVVHAPGGLVIGTGSGGVSVLIRIGGIFLYGTMRPLADLAVDPNGAQYGLAYVSGTYTIGPVPPVTGTFYHNGTATDVFQGVPTLLCNGHTTALAVDPTSGAFHPGRALTPAQLDLAIGSGGFGGIAYGNNLRAAYCAYNAL